MPKLYNNLIHAYLHNTDYKGAVVYSVDYKLRPDLTYAVIIRFKLTFSPSYDSLFWMVDTFEIDRHVIAVNRTEDGLTEVVFRNPTNDRSLFSPLMSIEGTACD